MKSNLVRPIKRAIPPICVRYPYHCQGNEIGISREQGLNIITYSLVVGVYTMIAVIAMPCQMPLTNP